MHLQVRDVQSANDAWIVASAPPGSRTTNSVWRT